MLCSGDKTTDEVRETWLLTKKINIPISSLSSDEIYALWIVLKVVKKKT